MSWAWQGRQLVKAEKDKTVTFTYDSEGIRTSKTVGNVKTSYLLNGTQILAQTTNGITLSFFYDQQGNRVAMADSSNHIYYYLYNLQGDVIALADSATGKLVATYTYDAWGKNTVQNATGFTAGTENPFRYRGYYYDSETELYYLQSRYYDAETGRFINADAFATTDITTPLSANMFAYCENNPVMRHDPLGEWAQILIGAAVGAGIQFMEDVIGAAANNKPLDSNFSSLGTYVAAAFSGAVPGGGFFKSTAVTILSTYIQTGVDAFAQSVGIESRETFEESMNKISTGAISKIAGDHIGSKADKVASHIGANYKGDNKWIKKGIKTARALVASAGKNISTFFNLAVDFFSKR